MSIRFRVEDMSCAHCVRAITQAVQEIDASAQVDADLDAKTVRVESSADAQALRGAIGAAGYSAQPLDSA
ncbi:MAG: heavy-metal-associated domain-containing protein [Burkholderiales bacterium]|nr:MAG: heavy-metal-associated domain-containing protein [Burkholderiales bacterium]